MLTHVVSRCSIPQYSTWAVVKDTLLMWNKQNKSYGKFNNKDVLSILGEYNLCSLDKHAVM